MDDGQSIRFQCAIDQLIEGSREIARATRAYYLTLTASGFEPDNAVVLAGGYQAALMAQIIEVV